MHYYEPPTASPQLVKIIYYHRTGTVNNNLKFKCDMQSPSQTLSVISVAGRLHLATCQQWPPHACRLRCLHGRAHRTSHMGGFSPRTGAQTGHRWKAVGEGKANAGGGLPGVWCAWRPPPRTAPPPAATAAPPAHASASGPAWPPRPAMAPQETAGVSGKFSFRSCGGQIPQYRRHTPPYHYRYYPHSPLSPKLSRIYACGPLCHQALPTSKG